MSEHIYDDTGVCVGCDRCADASCCEQVDCDRRKWAFLRRVTEATE